MIRPKHWWAGVLCAIVFFLTGTQLIYKTGIEQDEAIFATPFFRDWCFYAIPLGEHHRLPLMHMSYLGALKTWLYTPVFCQLPPSATTIRMPEVLLGSAAILLFWFLLHRIHGCRAALAGCVLLATDTIFQLTTTFDWGPDALQHLLTIGAMLLAVAWFQSGRPWLLAAAAFCCGLAFWDKAIFGWMFVGLCAGSLVFSKSILTRMTLRTAALAIAALLTGALPLIVYNLAGEPRFSTVKSNSHLAAISWANGWNSFRATNDGSILWGLTQDTAPQPGPPRSLVDQASFALHSMVGARRRNLMEPALITALILLPFLWRTRARNPMLFALIAIFTGWTFMLESGGGISAHHMVLLWPLPIFFLAIAFAEASLRSRYGKELLIAAVMVLAGTNLLVTNQYLYRFTRYGSTVAWTDAIYPLAAGLARTHASQVVLPDWGIADQLCVLNRNQPQAHQIAFPFMPPGDPPAQRQADLDILADERAIWVEHTASYEVRQGAGVRARQAAREAGFTPVMLDVYYDRYGRAIFQSYCLRRAK